MNVDDNPTIEGRAASRFLFVFLVSLWNMLSRVCMLMQSDIYCTGSLQTGCLLRLVKSMNLPYQPSS